MRVMDSNILIYHLNDQLPPRVDQQLATWSEEGSLISVITRIEVLGYQQPVSEYRKAQLLLSLFREVPLREPLVTMTIQFRQRYRLRIPDAVIAATAAHLDVPLVTRNVKDFGSVEEVGIINPFE